MANLNGTCIWFLDHGRCGKFTGWKMMPDDDGNPRRKYAPFCHEHQEAADAQDREEEAEYRRQQQEREKRHVSKS